MKKNILAFIFVSIAFISNAQTDTILQKIQTKFGGTWREVDKKLPKGMSSITLNFSNFILKNRQFNNYKMDVSYYGIAEDTKPFVSISPEGDISFSFQQKSYNPMNGKTTYNSVSGILVNNILYVIRIDPDDGMILSDEYVKIN